MNFPTCRSARTASKVCSSWRQLTLPTKRWSSMIRRWRPAVSENAFDRSPGDLRAVQAGVAGIVHQGVFGLAGPVERRRGRARNIDREVSGPDAEYVRAFHEHLNMVEGRGLETDVGAKRVGVRLVGQGFCPGLIDRFIAGAKFEDRLALGEGFERGRSVRIRGRRRRDLGVGGNRHHAGAERGNVGEKLGLVHCSPAISGLVLVNRGHDRAVAAGGAGAVWSVQAWCRGGGPAARISRSRRSAPRLELFPGRSERPGSSPWRRHHPR